MSAPRFQPGDRVRRITDSWAGVKVGDINTVSHQATDVLYLEGRLLGFDPNYFELVELVEAFKPAIMPRDDEDGLSVKVAEFRVRLVPVNEDGIDLAPRGLVTPVPSDPADYAEYADSVAKIVRDTILYVLTGEEPTP